MDTDTTPIRLRWQYCLGDQDITTWFTAELDADEVRAWDYDFCYLVVRREADNRWRIHSSDSMLPDDADAQTFGAPVEALDYLAQQHGLTYVITDDEP